MPVACNFIVNQGFYNFIEITTINAI